MNLPLLAIAYLLYELAALNANASLTPCGWAHYSPPKIVEYEAEASQKNIF